MSQPLRASEGQIPMLEAGATVQKSVGEGQRTRPSWHIQTQEEEGSEEVEGPAEVAACMCLHIFVVHLTRCSINCITLFNKDVSKTGSICFYVDRLVSHIL